MDETNEELRQRVVEQQQQILDLQALVKVYLDLEARYKEKDKLSTEFIKNICSSIHKMGDAVQGISEPQVDIK